MTRSPPRSAWNRAPSGNKPARRKGGRGREGSRTNPPPSGRSAPMNSSSRHFSSGMENPSGVTLTSAKGSCSSANALLHLARHVLEQVHFRGGQARALEEG